MSYEQGTTHYNLPQTLGDDKRDWFDTNKPFADVDAALYSAYEGVQTLTKDLSTVKADLVSAEKDIDDIQAHDTTVDVKVSALETLTSQHSVEIEDVRTDAEDMVCAVEETSATAKYAHEVGGFFRYNDTLYITTVKIGVGDTIVPNVNCKTTDVVTQLPSLEYLGSVSVGSNDHFAYKDGSSYRYGNVVMISFGLTITASVNKGVAYDIQLEDVPFPLMYAGTRDDAINYYLSPRGVLTIVPEFDAGSGNVYIRLTYLTK